MIIVLNLLISAFNSVSIIFTNMILPQTVSCLNCKEHSHNYVQPKAMRQEKSSRAIGYLIDSVR